MFFLSGFANFCVGFGAAMPEFERQRLLTAVETQADRDKWIAAAKADATTEAGKQRLERFEKYLASDAAAEGPVAELRASTTRRAEFRREGERRMNGVEQGLGRQMLDQFVLYPTDAADLRRVNTFLQEHEQAANDPTVNSDRDDLTAASLDKAGRILGMTFALLLAQWPLFWWPVCGLLFRGGAARWIAGLALVRKDGRPASVWVCGLRSLLTWLPLLLMLWLVLAVQVFQPYWVYARTFLWLLAVALLPLMTFLALRRPARSPIDRLLRTHIVPA
jgi:hypothetical protein